MAAAGPSSTQQVSEAVTALHGASAEHRDAANKWLLQFINSDAAWEAGVALLDAAHGGQLQFFGANMVLVKVRSSWPALSPEDQAHLTSVVRSALGSASRMYMMFKQAWGLHVVCDLRPRWAFRMSRWCRTSYASS
jgi:hypothetical protein